MKKRRSSRPVAARPAKLQQAVVHHQSGRLAQAESLYREILAQAPANADVLHLLGVVEAQRRNFAPAVELIGRALRIDPTNAAAHLNLGNALRALKRPAEALSSFDRALALKPGYADAFNNRGTVLLDLERPEEALASFDRALALKPGYADALNNRGAVLLDLRRVGEALASFDRALAIKPDYAEAHNNRGIALRELKRPQDALASFDRALAVKPDYAEALNNRGNALRDLKRPEEALASFDRALELAPRFAEALNNRGAALIDLKRLEEALASLDRALALNPDFAEALNARGAALLELRRPQEALASFDRVLALKPDYLEALNNRGNALRELKRPEQAAECYARLVQIAPEYGYAMGNLFSSRLYCCDWAAYDANAERLVDAVQNGRRADLPFPFLAVSPSASAQLRCARTFVADQYSAVLSPLWRGERYAHGTIRVAYVSADFRQHAVSYLAAGLFERHDRERFETIAISLRPEEQSTTGQRVKAAFSRFVDMSRKSDVEVATLVRELEVDIAVDLMGFTANCRTGIFAHRPAPIQVNYLGFPATMGADYIDYIMADRFVIPEDQQGLYAEKVVYLPDSFQVNDDERRIAEAVPTRLEAGLPESGFVFCSFNNSYKLNPPVFEVWMRLLKAVEGSVLWLVADNPSVQRNLRREAAARGIEAERLVFAPRLGYAEHLARLRLVDLFLDTLPFNAGTTASDALWAGVPVLTCAGEAFASRMAGSLLNAIGLPELITHSLEEYEALALKLAVPLPRLRRFAATLGTNGMERGARDERGTLLSELRERLARNHKTCPLFDTDRFRRHIERAYVTMWERYQRGEGPASFSVHAVSRSPNHSITESLAR